MFRQEQTQQILNKYPEDIEILDFNYARGKKTSGSRYIKGRIGIDEWGCPWYAGEDGVAGEVKDPPLKSLSDINQLTAPYEIFDGADFPKVNKMCSEKQTFTLAWTTVRPFERMQFLFGTEKLFTELAYGSKEIFLMRDVLHEFYKEEISRWIQTDVDGISFMDDWGYQSSLLISPDMWAEIFKPLYKEYCDLIHSKGKYAFFHSDGFIEEIYPGLIEVGIDAINSQLFCMNIEELGEKYKGKITFWGEMDRQHVLPFGTQQEVAQAVNRVKNALWMPQGGVIAQCEFGLQDPVENIEMVFQTWESIV